MNIKEKRLLLEFLEEYSDQLMNYSCNDFNFPDDWTIGEQLDFSQRAAPDFYKEMNDVGASEDDIPLGHDGMVFDYLIELLQVELNLDTDQD